MSAKLVTGPDGNDASLQGTTVRGSKPLHRFMKGQPKIIGVVVLVLGSSFFLISVGSAGDASAISLLSTTPPGFFQGVLLIVCGIVYILTEHNPTKKTVTISLALSIIAILSSFWCEMCILPAIGHEAYEMHHYYEEGNVTEEVWRPDYEAMGLSLELIFVFYNFVGAIIFIVMSALAGAALRSKSQVVVVMTAAASETPGE